MSVVSNEIELEPVELIDFHGDVLLMTSESAIPPGSRVLFSIPWEKDGQGEAAVFRGKLVSLRKDSLGRFELKIRLNSVTRLQRATLAGLTG